MLTKTWGEGQDFTGFKNRRFWHNNLIGLVNTFVMPGSIPHVNSQSGISPAFRQGWDIDFIRAKFNLSARQVEKAIQDVGANKEKIIEYLKKLVSGK